VGVLIFGGYSSVTKKTNWTYQYRPTFLDASESQTCNYHVIQNLYRPYRK